MVRRVFLHLLARWHEVRSDIDVCASDARLNSAIRHEHKAIRIRERLDVMDG